MRSKSYLGLGTHGFHRLCYTEWGDDDHRPVVVCVHGLTRNSRDFDYLAAALAGEYRVVCPDVVGRGKSDWLTDAGAYGYPQYLSDMNALIARLDVRKVSWLGTSMGGLIGMMLAAQPGSPIAKLILNDVGPLVPKAALERIAAYVGQENGFETLAALEQYLRQVHAPFGPMNDAGWRHLAEHSARRLDNGGYALAYDPGIGTAFRSGKAIEDVDLWAIWDAVRCPVLALRGADSDLLLADTSLEMRRRGPKAEVVEIEGVGHCPALMDDQQIGLVREWLTAVT